MRRMSASKNRRRVDIPAWLHAELAQRAHAQHRTVVDLITELVVKQLIQSGEHIAIPDDQADTPGADKH
jgi:hypothetical protein